MLNIIELIKQFNDKFDVYNAKRPSLNEDYKEQVQLRISLMKEELNEYITAINISDLEGALDALVDLTYVVFGTIAFHGFFAKKKIDVYTSTVFELAFNRVHLANMKKVKAEKEEDSKRGSSFDIVKPEGWQAPILHDLLEKGAKLRG